MAKLKLKVVAAITILMVWSLESVIGDPQQNLLSNECSDVTVNDLSSFNRNLNVSFAEMRAQVSNHGKYFATAQSTTGTEPVYAMFQCMNYVSVTDCAACFDAAAVEIRNCSAPITNGARVVYDGCFLSDQASKQTVSLVIRVVRGIWQIWKARNNAIFKARVTSERQDCNRKANGSLGVVYESSDFFGKNILPGNNMRCGHQIAVEVTTFSTIVQQILKDLQIAIPKISGFFANTKTKVADIAIYIVAQCAETFKQDKCLNCLSIQHNNLKACLPNTNGWSIDPAGCFTRYSDTPFFADNQTTDISPFLKQGGSSSKKWVIFPGTVGGVILVVILLSLFFWHRRSQSPKRTPRDYALGKTELKAPTKYKYSDLKAATRNFSEKNKLGEGGFGVVYKVVDDDGEEDYLLRQAWKLYEKGNFLELVDKSLDPDTYDAKEVKKVLDIALLCTQASAATRPAMSEVVVLLSSNNLFKHMRPLMPIFFESKLRPNKDISTSTSSSTTNATTSNFILPAR
ncbi:hypothetical protein VNO78_21825 [Psophocarpus tetragonolobus]|uniref:Gnk2-homologous domain-containing protein n=1 Tax=Psophocarpus tetragonolobus TaxID=3891 RepID=A0AAN9SBP5_PSOTE